MPVPETDAEVKRRTSKKVTQQTGYFKNLRTLPHPIEDTLPPPRHGAPPHIPGTESVPRAESVPRKGHLRLSNEFVYDIMPRLKPGDGYVLLYLIARTHGFRQSKVTVTLESIAKACSVSRSQARVNVNSHISKGYIRHLGTDSSNRNPLLRGLLIEVLQPSMTGTDYAPLTDYLPGTESTPIKNTE